MPAAPSRQPVRLQPVLDIDGQRYSLNAPSIVLGRSSEADILVDDTGVSRRHLEIRTASGVTSAVDLGSTNGSYVNGHKVAGSTELTDGSTITMGRTKDHLPPASRQPWGPPMSELTITALRFGFLLLLWVLIFSIVSAMRRDLMIGRKAATGAPTARQVRKNPELAERSAAAAQAAGPPTGGHRRPAQGNHHPPGRQPHPVGPRSGSHPGT